MDGKLVDRYEMFAVKNRMTNDLSDFCYKKDTADVACSERNSHWYMRPRVYKVVKVLVSVVEEGVQEDD